MGGRRRLIVNADGYGFGAGATQGIRDTIRKGRFVSSISVNANFPDALRVGELASEFPQISIGVHLNPLVGRPCLPPERVPSLVGADGFFHERDFLARLRRGAIRRGELEAELDAQVERIKDLVGDRLTHLDSQAHSHLHYFDLFMSVAQRWKVERIRTNASLICLESPGPKWSRLRAYVRRPHVWAMHRYRHVQMRAARRRGLRLADRLVTVGYAGTGNKTRRDNWTYVLRNLPAGTYEIYCHPAYPDDTIRRWSYYREERAQELDLLCRSDFRDVARDAGVEVVSFLAV
jgi:chitin disaccharide deacetylase